MDLAGLSVYRLLKLMGKETDSITAWQLKLSGERSVSPDEMIAVCEALRAWTKKPVDQTDMGLAIDRLLFT